MGLGSPACEGAILQGVNPNLPQNGDGNHPAKRDKL